MLTLSSPYCAKRVITTSRTSAYSYSSKHLFVMFTAMASFGAMPSVINRSAAIMPRRSTELVEISPFTAFAFRSRNSPTQRRMFSSAAAGTSAWLLVIAAIRSALVLAISQKNREVQYEKLTSFAANIYADIFFLQKSKKQLDEMTTRSFSIYQALPHESPLRQRALSLANMGHEVMKDYSNIVSGLAKAIQVTQQESPMLLSQICRILEAGTRETIAPARLHIHLEGDILIEGYYDFFIVLNNLIINAAQAGAHQITAELTAKNRSIVMRVADDAGGIPDDILPHIFQPGFSTKFDEQTGVPSPGLGLCHVRDIVNKWNAQISVESSVPEGTTFRVDIPSL